MRTIKYGGQIVPGDFIAIAFGNTIDFGWYAGNGRGTLQYYTFRGPANANRDYQDCLKMTDKEKSEHKWQTKRFEKGLTTKCLWKSYINSVYDSRIVKITNVEDIFTDSEDRQDYEKSRETLITLNIIKQ